MFFLFILLGYFYCVILVINSNKFILLLNFSYYFSTARIQVLAQSIPNSNTNIFVRYTMKKITKLLKYVNWTQKNVIYFLFYANILIFKTYKSAFQYFTTITFFQFFSVSLILVASFAINIEHAYVYSNTQPTL